MFSGILSYFFGFLLCALWPVNAHAQGRAHYIPEPSAIYSDTTLSDTNLSVADTLKRSLASVADTLLEGNDSAADTSQIKPMSAGSLADSLSSQPESAFSSPISYSWKDSMVISVKDQKAFLYGGATVKFEDKQLTADYIEFDMAKSIAYATGRKDSAGQMIGLPVFTQGQESFDVRSLSYNFKTKSGVIHDVITEQQESFLHGSVAKRYDSGIVDIKDGKFTTCDADHPHFYLAISKGRMIPGKKIVAGPSYLVLEDVPLPIGIPFGFLPNTSKRNQSGFLLPTWGDEVARGFNLTGGGYYLALGQHLDARITGDIYSKGTWGLGMAANYVKRYRFSGQFNGRYYKDITGEKGLDRTASTSFSLQWMHRQDPKANPTSSLNASVNFSTKSFDQNHNYQNVSRLMTNTKQSSISWAKNWPSKPYRLTMNLNHSQSSGADLVQMTLPSANFSVDRLYPFRKKVSAGTKKWYEDITFSYSAEMRNDISSPEDKLLSDSTLRNMRNGFKHTIPVNLNVKVFKQINITPSLNYTGMLYTSSLRKRWVPGDQEVNPEGSVVTDTLRNLSYAHGFAPNISASFSPKIYIRGQALNQNAKIQAIRNVVTTAVSFRFTPDLSMVVPNYYRDLEYTYIDKNGESVTKKEKYSIYQGYTYGTPTLPGKSGAISLSIRNNLEAKIKSDKDTTGVKKIKLLENLSFSTGYNIFADSMRLSVISMNGNTSLFNNILNLSFSGSIDPYAIDDKGKRYDRLMLKDGKLGRLTSLSFSPSFRLQGGQGKQKGRGSSESDTNPSLLQSQDELGPSDDSGRIDPDRYRAAGVALPYEYFKIPWSMGVSYDMNYSKPGKTKASVVQTVRINGDLSLTPKWKMSFNTGYDVETKQVTHTNFTIDRDLHCWVMSLNVSPFGRYKFYGFQINVRSAMLRDLKYEKSRSQYDSQSF